MTPEPLEHTLPTDSPRLANEQAVVHKVLRRLIPFCMLCYLMNYIDRVNVSVAGLQMINDPAKNIGIPGLTQRWFDLGTAVFFVGYCLFEVPSNLIMQKVGARRWIARIMISWGAVTIALLWTTGPISFNLYRLLLGIAEAGFFPGMILYFSRWVPHRYRARTAALFLTSTAVAGLFGNPLGGTIMYLTRNHPFGIAPWQWLFVYEGLPAIILGLITLFYMTDKPAQASWLRADERDTLTTLLEREHADHPGHGTAELRHAFSSKHTWILSALYGLMIFGFYQINFYTPTIIKAVLKSAGATTDQTPGYIADLWACLLAAIPFGAAALGMVLIGRHSDRANERKMHLVFTCVLSFAGMVIAALAPRLPGNWATAITILGLSIGAIGAFGMFGPFWALPPQLLTGTAAAASVAIINSIGNFIGGYGGPFLRGSFAPDDSTLTTTAIAAIAQERILFLSAAMALCGLLLAWLAPIPKSKSSR